MPHGQPPGNQIFFDAARQFEKPQCVGHRLAALAHAFSDLFLGESELIGQPREAVRLFDRIKVLPIQVLNERNLQRLGVGNFPDNRRNFFKSSFFRSPPPALSDYQLISIFAYLDYNWLEHSVLPNRPFKLFKLFVVKIFSGLLTAGLDLVNEKIQRPPGRLSLRNPGFEIGNQGFNSFSQRLSVHATLSPCEVSCVVASFLVR